MGCGASSEADKDLKNGPVPNARQKMMDEVEHIELTEGVIQHYVGLEKEIYRFEKKNVLKKYEAKMVYADELKKTVDQLEATYKELKKQTEKEKADVENIEQPSVRAFLKQQGTWEQKFDKEQQEYVEALNRQEIAEKELQGAKMQYERAAKLATAYKKRSDKLNEMYEEQDKLLAGIFGGEYGSELENTLEAQLDDCMEWQQRIALAKFKWTNGRVLLVHANTQMAFGITRWKGLQSIDLSNTRMRYFAAAEARNNFIAACQNVQSCRVYLGKVNFPYCTEEEMANLEATVNSAFTDIQTNSSYNRALEIYQYTHKKVTALIQWFDQVIHDTILKDLEKANSEVSKIQKELRNERMRLIKEKAREKLGRDITLSYDDTVSDDDDDEIMALEADRVRDGDDLPGERLQGLLNMSQPDGRMPSPVPQNELAPTPGKDALFGDVAKKMEEFSTQKRELQKRQGLQREKQNMQIQERIKKRKEMKRRTHADRRKSVNPMSFEQLSAA